MGSGGKMTQKSMDMLVSQGYKVNMTESSNPVSLMDRLKETFGSRMGQHKRIDWHDEPGKKFSNFFKGLIEHEGKQQMLYLGRNKDGGVMVDAGKILKNLIGNVEGKFPSFGQNPDGSVDSKLADLMGKLTEWNKNGEIFKHLQIAIIPDDAANKSGESILLQNFGNNGKMELDKILSDMFENPDSIKDGKLPFKFMELRLDGHVLATASGMDMANPVAGSSSSYLFERETPWSVPPVVPFYPRMDLEGKRKRRKGRQELEVLPPPPIVIPQGQEKDEDSDEKNKTDKDPENPKPKNKENKKSEPQEEKKANHEDRRNESAGTSESEEGKGKENRLDQLEKNEEKAREELGITKEENKLILNGKLSRSEAIRIMEKIIKSLRWGNDAKVKEMMESVKNNEKTPNPEEKNAKKLRNRMLKKFHSDKNGGTIGKRGGINDTKSGIIIELFKRYSKS